MDENARFLKPYIRGLPIILLSMVLGYLFANKYLNYTTPMYESTVKMRLADVNEGVSNSNLYKDLDVFATSNKIAAEIEILKSQLLMNKVLDKLDFDTEIFRVGKLRDVELYNNSPFLLECISSVNLCKNVDVNIVNTKEVYVNNIKTTFNKEIIINKCVFRLTLNDSLIKAMPEIQVEGNYRIEFLTREQLIGRINKHLDIIPVDKDVPVVRISFKSANPIKAALLVNKIADTYIEDYIETKFLAANVTVNFLNTQLDLVKSRLENKENDIQAYRDTKGITNLTQETETDLRKISQLNIQLVNLKMSLKAIQELEAYIKKGREKFLDLAPNFEAFTDLLSTEMVKKIKTLQSEKKDLLLTFTPLDEKVQVIDAKINDLTSYLEESIRNTRKSYEIKYKNIQIDINEAEKEFIGVPEKEKILTILNRDFNIYQQSYNFLNSKKIEAEIAQSAKIAFHRIISPAEISKTPVSPNKTIIVILCTILGMFLSITLIFVVHLLKAKVNDSYTVETNSAIPIVAYIPKLTNESAIAQYFNKILIKLEVKKLIPCNGIICLSSFTKEDGIKFVSKNLISALHNQERNVLVIDSENILSFLTDSIEEIVKNEIGTFTSLTNSKYEYYTKEKYVHLINEFRKSYDMIVIINETFDIDIKSEMLMSIADINYILLDTRLTPENKIMECDKMKAEYGLQSLYFILNRFAYNPTIFKEIYLKIKSIKKYCAFFKKK